MQPLGSTALRHACQPRAQPRVASGAGEEASRERAVVQARPPDENRQSASRRDVANRGGRLTRVPRSGVLLHRVGNVDEMMKDSAALIERDLVGTDVESTIDRRRIAADDFATEPLRQRDAERALTDRSWPQDGDEPRPMAHGTDSARTNASAASTASSIIKPICCVRFGRVMRAGQDEGSRVHSRF